MELTGTSHSNKGHFINLLLTTLLIPEPLLPLIQLLPQVPILLGSVLLGQKTPPSPHQPPASAAAAGGSCLSPADQAPATAPDPGAPSPPTPSPACLQVILLALASQSSSASLLASSLLLRRLPLQLLSAGLLLHGLLYGYERILWHKVDITLAILADVKPLFTKLDGVGPIDNRPYTDKFHHLVRKKKKLKKNGAHDM